MGIYEGLPSADLVVIGTWVVVAATVYLIIRAIRKRK